MAIFYEQIRDKLRPEGIDINLLIDIATDDVPLPVSQINLNEQNFKGQFTNFSPSPEVFEWSTNPTKLGD